ncbi:MAG TPA: TRAFs-binding domain-containing protein [Candidatus Binatia bacterium]|nr:TRAFs-binding domain-containing protein [Candidatus Binatia bacterium]
MDNDTQLDEVRERAKKALDTLRGLWRDEDMQASKVLVESLRNHREYELMGQLAEAVSRCDPKDAKNRRFYAQYLIDTGKATAAIDLLQPLARRLPKEDPEFAEATGLLGRAHKQIFFDAGDKTAPGAREALKKAIATYRGPYEVNHKNTWHGVNLIALLARARGLGIRVAPELNPAAIARDVVATLQATPAEKRDEWFLPTLAEASLGLRDWDVIERNVREYVTAKDAKAFQIASTLRQFTEVWDLETADARGRALVDILRARLMQLEGGSLEFAPEKLQELRQQAPPADAQLEAVLGRDGPQTYQWWKTGLERALSVAAVRQRLGGRVGTGFLVRAGDLGREPAEELLLLTNFHVINEHGASPGIRPDEAEVAFEAVDAGKPYAVERILWSSPPDRHDASVLRLETPVTGVAPLPMAAALPVIDETARIYIVGHPGGRDLAFSFQDNELLDHEGPPLGKLQVPGVCRLHYRAPTEGGSSGSPVFNSRLWQVVALHHKGGKIGMAKLNGKEGTYGANEGISIQSIAAAMKG